MANTRKGQDNRLLTSDEGKSKNILQDPPSETKELHEVKEAASSSKEKDDKKKDEKEAKESKDKAEKKGSKDDEKEKKEPEPNFDMVEILQNPARVLRQQLKVIQLLEGSPYVTVKDIQIGGIVMVKHIQTDTEEELVKPVAAFGPKPEEEKEADPPEPFEYTED